MNMIGFFILLLYLGNIIDFMDLQLGAVTYDI